MKKLFFGSLMLAVALGLTSCRRDLQDPVDGVYVGTFKVIYPTEDFEGSTRVTLENGRYECEGNEEKLPAGGSGEYTVKKRTILFEDENAWTADFDWNRVLGGEYGYTFDGKTLKLVKDRMGIGYYEYNLELQE
jgi:hypothetical protein